MVPIGRTNPNPDSPADYTAPLTKLGGASPDVRPRDEHLPGKNMDADVQGTHCHSPHDPSGSIGRYVTLHLGEAQKIAISQFSEG